MAMTTMEGISAPAGCGVETADPMVSEVVHILKATEDKFGGVIIDSHNLPTETAVFLDSLKHSLMQWKTQVLCILLA